MLKHIGLLLARFLSTETHTARPPTCSAEQLATHLCKGDILLVEGNSRFSTAIKYLTQSTWSHAALCIGKESVTDSTGKTIEKTLLLEADVVEGVRKIYLQRYSVTHTRICRPVGLTAQEIEQVISFALARLGYQYDLRNILDLARYLVHTPPVPTRWRRRMLALGSGDPTRAICSSLIAQAFQSVRYPILPDIIQPSENNEIAGELFHIRHHSLFTPRDFDLSPYFRVVKPTLESGFNPHQIQWVEPVPLLERIEDVYPEGVSE